MGEDPEPLPDPPWDCRASTQSGWAKVAARNRAIACFQGGQGRPSKTMWRQDPWTRNCTDNPSPVSHALSWEDQSPWETVGEGGVTVTEAPGKGRTLGRQ